jgi:acyl-CoA thioester hydrolase
MDRGLKEVTRFVAHQWLCDHFGHLNVRNYASMFDDSIFIFWGKRRAGRDDGAIVPVTAELRIVFHAEVTAGTVVTVESEVRKVGTKSVGLCFRMMGSDAGELLATCDVVEVFFHLDSRESCPIPAGLRSELEAELQGDSRHLRHE